jgi:hypothetical protein
MGRREPTATRLSQVPKRFSSFRAVRTPAAPDRPVEAGEELDPILGNCSLDYVPGLADVPPASRPHLLPVMVGEALCGGHAEAKLAPPKEPRHSERFLPVSARAEASTPGANVRWKGRQAGPRRVGLRPTSPKSGQKCTTPHPLLLPPPAPNRGHIPRRPAGSRGDEW